MEALVPSTDPPPRSPQNEHRSTSPNGQRALHILSVIGSVPFDSGHEMESDSSKMVRLSSSLTREPQKLETVDQQAHPAFWVDERESSAESIVVRFFRKDDKNTVDPISQSDQTKKLAQDADVTMTDAFVNDGTLLEQMVSPRTFAHNLQPTEETQDTLIDFHNQMSKMRLISRAPAEYLRFVGRGLDIVKCYVGGAPLLGVLRSRLTDNDYKRYTPATFVKLPPPQYNQHHKSAPEYYLSITSPSEKFDAWSPLLGLFDDKNQAAEQHETRVGQQIEKSEARQSRRTSRPYEPEAAPRENNADEKDGDSIDSKPDRPWSEVDKSSQQAIEVEAYTASRPKSVSHGRNMGLVANRDLPMLSSGSRTLSAHNFGENVSARSHHLISNDTKREKVSGSLELSSASGRASLPVSLSLRQNDPQPPSDHVSKAHVEHRNPERRMINAAETNSKNGHTKDPIFPVLQQPILLSFAKLPIGELSERIQFLATNQSALLASEVVEDIINKLYEQAIKCFRARQQAPGQQCIYCCVLIQLCRRMSPTKQQKFLSSVRKTSEKQLQEFQKLLDNLSLSVSDESGQSIEYVQPKPPIPSTKPPFQSTRATSRITQLQQYPSGKNRLLANTSLRGNEQRSERVDMHRQRSITIHFDDSLSFGSGGVLTHLYQSESNMTSRAVDPSISLVPEIRQLDSKYKTRPGKTFFERGRVFAVLWQQPLGQTRNTTTETLHEQAQINPNITIGSHGEGVFNQIRRMIVIRNRNGYCWCVSMGTYAGQGLCKKGLQPEEINAHAVVHDTNLSPSYLPDEPRSNKRPIAVNLAPGEYLEPATRVHLAKPSTVEWNVKVRNVGKVVNTGLELLMAYVKEELLR